MHLRSVLPVMALVLSTLTACSGKKEVARILLLARDRDYGTYTAEILETEGFKEYQLDSLSGGRVNASLLRQVDLVILAESGIGPAGQQLIRKYVKKGGNLIAFRPDAELADLFGIIPEGRSLSDGYIRIDTTSGQGAGLHPGPMQYHGSADIHAPKGCTILADLYADRTTSAGFPAVVAHDFGKGHTTAFLYDLPISIVYTRQGNPLNAGVEKDSIPGLRGMDLFADGWVDTANNTINQADEQMALLSHCMEEQSRHTGPLPRFWYFPDSLKCLVTLTNDGEYRSEPDFEPQLRDVDSMGAKMSLYILKTDKVSKAWINAWTAKGFEIAGHPDDTRRAVNPGWRDMDSALLAMKTDLAERCGIRIRTNVNHWFVWCGRLEDGTPDFGAQAKLEARHGIELDINYAHYDMKSNQGDHYLGPLGTRQGNFTGSGMVMRFADAGGKVIPVYQHFNAVYDQEYNESHDPEGFFNCFKGLMDRSLNNDVLSFISVKSHNDEYFFSKIPLLKMLAYARTRGVPVWTELQLMDFIRMREEASFRNPDWSGDRLAFNVVSGLGHPNGLTFLLPIRHNDLGIKGVTVNGQIMPYAKMKFKGREYARLTVVPGHNYTVSANYE